ncbi:MAG TPA: hypothetical protein VF841_12235, partial [Anaeromyxobacter sp.]
GRPALAIEVKVTHAVEPEKEAALAAAAVPAVEVDAREDWEQPGADGGVAIGCARSLGFLPCPACAARERAERDRALGGEAAEIAELEAYRARGLLGGAPLRAARGLPRRAGAEDPLSSRDRAILEEAFRCPECGASALEFGARLARHACPGSPARPVAWRGYDGSLVALGWWRSRRPRSRS